MNTCIRRALVAVVAAATAWSGAAAASAHAVDTGTGAQRAVARPVVQGSVVFVRKFNVWIARADGSHARRLTRDGTRRTPYRTPSEDSRGHVVALRGDKLVRMSQAGRVLQRFTPPGTALSTDFASVSPDGSKIAYSVQTSYQDSSGHTYFEHTLYYTSATRPRLVRGTHPQQDALWASWITNSRVVIGTHSDPALVRYHDIRARKAKKWFTDCDAYINPCSTNPDASNYNTFPAVSPQGDRYAAALMGVTGTFRNKTLLVVRQTSGAATGSSPAAPGAGCSYSGVDSKGSFPGPAQASIQTPSFSPNGRALVAAFKSAGGGWSVYRVDIGASVTRCAAYHRTVIAKGANQPRWSAARLN